MEDSMSHSSRKVLNKVWTAKGLRDQRCRLSPSVALQLFDIQDKLGYEQPSKAVDWLITQAKPFIDSLPAYPPSPLSNNHDDGYPKYSYQQVPNHPTLPYPLQTVLSSPSSRLASSSCSCFYHADGSQGDSSTGEQVHCQKDSRAKAGEQVEEDNDNISSVMIQSMSSFMLEDESEDSIGNNDYVHTHYGCTGEIPGLLY